MALTNDELNGNITADKFNNLSENDKKRIIDSGNAPLEFQYLWYTNKLGFTVNKDNYRLAKLLYEKYPNFGQLPDNYKQRMLNNPHFQAWYSYSPSGWDSAFNPSKVQDTQNKLYGNVIEYWANIFQEYQTWYNSLPSTQYSQQFAAGVYPDSSTVGNSSIQDNDNVVSPVSTEIGGFSPQTALQAASTFASVYSAAITAAGGIMQLGLLSQQKKNLLLDEEYKQINNESAAFAVAEKAASFFAKPADTSMHEGDDIVPSVKVDTPIFPNSRIQSAYARIMRSKKQENTEVAETLGGLKTGTEINELTSTSPFAPGNSDGSTEFFAKYREQMLTLMKIEQDYKTELAKLGIEQTDVESQRLGLESELLSNDEYRSSYLSGEISGVQAIDAEKKYLRRVYEAGMNFYYYALEQAAGGNQYFQTLIMNSEFLKYMSSMGISSPLDAMGVALDSKLFPVDKGEGYVQ